jgi:hypothetical protein
MTTGREVPRNRQINESDRSSDEPIFLPTVEACDAFNIARTNTAKVNKTTEDSIGFLQGKQFRTNIFANDAKSRDRKNPKLFLTGDVVTDPNNKKLTKNIIDEVCIEFIGNAPTKVQAKRKDGITVTEIEEKTVKEPYLIMNVAPSDTDWMSFSHDHEWESGGGILQQILTTVSSAVQVGADLMNVFQNVKGNINGTNDFKAGRISKPDFTSTYKGSSQTELTIPFVLFTPGGQIQDFIRDIYYPIMLLNFLSYPKRVDTIFPDDSEQSNINDSTGSQSQTKANQDPNSSGALTQAVNAINTVYPGFRYSILEPPSYIRVTHSSGLFRFPMCAITNFSYNYKGPWVNMNKEVVKMPEYSAFTRDATFMKRGFPCIAECKLAIRTVDPLYADDWATMFNLSDVVTVSRDTSSEGAIKTYRTNQQEEAKEYEEQLSSSRFGGGVRFASNVGVNIGFRGRL